MTMFKKNGGFTLVELIVVIAILAILAGVAIPAYSGYITKAQDAKIVTELDAIQTAAQAANATNTKKITAIIVDGTTITFEGLTTDTKELQGFVKDFGDFYKAITATGTAGEYKLDLDLANTSYANGATWSEATGKWTANSAPTTP